MIVIYTPRWRDIPWWAWLVFVEPWWSRLTRHAARETDHPARLQ